MGKVLIASFGRDEEQDFEELVHKRTAGAKRMDFLIELIANFIGEVLEWLLGPFVNKIAARWKHRKKK